ncbi:MAG: phosphonopyruvate decarboxylase [Gammaproteobacteria bacterium]
MLNTHAFGTLLKSYGFDFFSGVPCSYLKNLINYAINECDYVIANNEGDAIATCAGAYLGGRRPVFLCQNSGLSNATSPLISLNYPFRIPQLGFISLRGDKASHDEPQHELMGEITEKMLSLMKIQWKYLSTDLETAKKQLEYANNILKNNESFFFIVKKNTFENEKLKSQDIKSYKHQILENNTQADELPKRSQALSILNEHRDPNTVLLATTGFTGRELYTIKDHPLNFYMVGSMGCISAIGLGLAIARPDKKIIAIDGDGALLMRLGTLATNGYYQPKNLLHILLDNQQHESTGGQATLSSNVRFPDIANAVCYPNAYCAPDLATFTKRYQQWLATPCLSFLMLKIHPGSLKNLGRPAISPEDLKNRLLKKLNP